MTDRGSVRVVYIAADSGQVVLGRATSIRVSVACRSTASRWRVAGSRLDAWTANGGPLRARELEARRHASQGGPRP